MDLLKTPGHMIPTDRPHTPHPIKPTTGFGTREIQRYEAIHKMLRDVGCSGGPTVVGMVSGALNNNLRMGILAAVVFPVLLLAPGETESFRIYPVCGRGDCKT